MKKTLTNNNWAYQFNNKHEKHFIIESLKLTCPRIINYPDSAQESGYLIDEGKDTLTESTTIDENVEIISFYLCLEMTFHKLSKKLKNAVHLNFICNVLCNVCSILHHIIWAHVPPMEHYLRKNNI